MLWICVFHALLINPLEKLLCYFYFKNPMYRPYRKTPLLSNLGMPSGHVEVACLLSCMLYYESIIKYDTAILFTWFMMFQRYLFDHHTMPQVLGGLGLGYVYSLFYYYANYSIGLTYSIVLVYTSAIFYKIYENMISYPEWLDNEVIYTLEYNKKSLLSNLQKLLYTLLFQKNMFYASWKDIEKELDEKLIAFEEMELDSIVGITKGGAVIANYLSTKLNKPYQVSLNTHSHHILKHLDKILYVSDSPSIFFNFIDHKYVHPKNYLLYPWS
jgi:hypothetical protein